MIGGYDSIQLEYGRLMDALLELERLSLVQKRIEADYELSENYSTALARSHELVAASMQDVSAAVREFAVDDAWHAAKEHEERIKSAMKAVEGACGGHLEGLDFRLKTRESLSRKVSTEAADFQVMAAGTRNLVWKDVAASMKDVLRFTIVLPFDGFVDRFFDAKASLESNGLRFSRIKNTFANTDGSYKGVNTNLLDEQSGYVFELQFHTTTSFNVKEYENHELYEFTRNPENEGKPEYYEALRKQRENFERIPVPERIEEIESM